MSSSAKPTPTGEPSSDDIGPESRSSAMSVRLAQTGANGEGIRSDETPTLDGAQVAVFNPHRTLQPDGTVEEGFAEREVVDALHGPTGNKEPLILSQADSPVKTSPSPADEGDSQESDPASSSSSPESLTLFSPMEDGSSLRTYPDSFPPKADEISQSYSRRWASSGFTTSPGECWTADTSECPSEGGAYSSLRDVLEAEVPARFYLSPRAAAGILRRAEKRGKELPAALNQALLTLSKSREDQGGREPATTPMSQGSSPDEPARGRTQPLTTEPSSPTPSDPKASTPPRTEPGETPR